MKHECSLENAPKFAKWIRERGGVAHWKSVNLGNPSASWSSPALTPEGEPYPKPTWEADDKPEIITDPALITVYEAVLVERVPVKLRICGEQSAFVLTKASEARLDKAVKAAGEGAFYVRSGDLMFPEMAVLKSKNVGTLKEWISQKES